MSWGLKDMSAEEQDYILWKLQRQRDGSWSAVNAMAAKIQDSGAAMAEASKKLRSHDLLGPDGVKAIHTAMEAVGQIPDRQAVIDSLKELKAELERCRDLQAQVARFHNPPDPP